MQLPNFLPLFSFSYLHDLIFVANGETPHAVRELSKQDIVSSSKLDSDPKEFSFSDMLEKCCGEIRDIDIVVTFFNTLCTTFDQELDVQGPPPKCRLIFR